MHCNIGEARLSRDHNIDRKEIALRGRRFGTIFSLPAPAEARRRRGGARSVSNGLIERPGPDAGKAGSCRFLGNVAILYRKQIPLFLKML
jgi:hypothetical protein